MSRLTNDEIRNRAISIIRNLTAEENGLTHGDLGILSSFLLIERTDKDKLTHYKDLEEQGRLIELPCSVGDTVWYTDREDDGKGVVPCTVRNESFACIVKDLWGIKFFATKEEAEAKLKELENE